MNYWIFAFGMFVGVSLGLIIAALCGAAGHADHQADLHEAYQAGFKARGK